MPKLSPDVRKFPYFIKSMFVHGCGMSAAWLTLGVSLFLMAGYYMAELEPVLVLMSGICLLFLVIVLFKAAPHSRDEEELRQSLIMLDYAYKELQGAHEELKIANEKSMEAVRLKSEFMANMSHELRTPLNSVIALSDILLSRMDGDLTGEQEKQVKIIQKSGRHLLELISDVLDLSKIVAGKMEINTEEFHIEEVVDDARTTVTPLATEKGHDITFIMEVDIPLIISDRNKLKQILLNLLANAVKFTPRGGSITIHARHKDDSVEIQVKDNGIGIAGENLEKIFDEFRQVDGSYTREYGGTGLGLAITRRLVNLLGGEIGVESEIGKGTTFTVSIPEVLRGAGERNA